VSRKDEFSEFAHLRAGQLYRSAWLLTGGDHHRSEDLVQETLAKVYVRWTRVQAGPINNPVAYAHTALVRTFLTAQRRRSQHETPTDDLPTTEVAGPDYTLRLTLAESLSRLKPLDRAVLMLRFLDDLSVNDTAAQLGLSSGAVSNRTARALERLRADLGPALADLRYS
jgi:RNA polymerase sigma-70 factor (sigma-E family)